MVVQGDVMHDDNRHAPRVTSLTLSGEAPLQTTRRRVLPRRWRRRMRGRPRRSPQPIPVGDADEWARVLCPVNQQRPPPRLNAVAAAVAVVLLVNAIAQLIRRRLAAATIAALRSATEFQRLRGQLASSL